MVEYQKNVFRHFHPLALMFMFVQQCLLKYIHTVFKKEKNTQAYFHYLLSTIVRVEFLMVVMFGKSKQSRWLRTF